MNEGWGENPQLLESIRSWEEDGVLPGASFPSLRRTLLALDLFRSRMTDAEVESAVARMFDALPLRVGTVPRRIRAILRTDLMQADPSLRSSAVGAPHVYQTDDYTITVSWLPHEGIRGSIYPRESEDLPTGIRVLVDGDGVPVTEGGSFHVPHPKADEVLVIVQIEDSEIQVGPLERP